MSDFTKVAKFHNSCTAYSDQPAFAPPTSYHFTMSSSLSNVRTCVPLVEERVARREATVASAIKAVSAENGIKPAGLKASFYRNSPKLDHHRNRLLSNESEDILVWALQAFSLCNKPLTIQLCVGLAGKLFQVAPSTGWVSNFLRRHSDDLKCSRTKQLSKARNN